MEAKIKHLREKNLRMKILLAELVNHYGDRPTYGEGLFTPEFQPRLIRRAMKEVGPESYCVIEACHE